MSTDDPVVQPLLGASYTVLPGDTYTGVVERLGIPGQWQQCGIYNALNAGKAAWGGDILNPPAGYVGSMSSTGCPGAGAAPVWPLNYAQVFPIAPPLAWSPQPRSTI